MNNEEWEAEERRQDAVVACRSRRNRRVFAERLAWPDGALATCERLEDTHPGWSVGYLLENRIRGFERPAGYQATRVRGEVRLFDPDPERLREAIEHAPEDRWS